jgi:hypothetical protein
MLRNTGFLYRGFMWLKFFSDATINKQGFLGTLERIDPICGSLVPLNATNEIQVGDSY